MHKLSTKLERLRRHRHLNLNPPHPSAHPNLNPMLHQNPTKLPLRPRLNRSTLDRRREYIPCAAHGCILDRIKPDPNHHRHTPRMLTVHHLPMMNHHPIAQRRADRPRCLMHRNLIDLATTARSIQDRSLQILDPIRRKHLGSDPACTLQHTLNC